MGHYKSWSGLKKQLEQFLCEEFRGRITYFLARYHQVHNSYGRAAIRLDGNELVCFSWIEMYQQDADLGLQWRERGAYDDKALKEKWDREKTIMTWIFWMRLRSSPECRLPRHWKAKTIS